MVTGPAYGNQRSSNALQFAKALFLCGHNITKVFFYQEGVYNANIFTLPASDEIDIVRSWQIFAKEKKIKLEVCIGAALRRGVVDTTQFNIVIGNLPYGFRLSSLGNLAQLILSCDRFIKF